ncbi:uncharacterized protein LOC121260270 [Juglans microcarpa x Juglans regia]|uniref:uncharacterized protein LOC121260270 n=1 Tax=Juglans microcarpa x Juglans regia TaxID=2249226 RepID=UPI001B7EE8F3|nr:uncharacterized protein LOC121260270 [Juglans microcarpa x Juglans regia]
MASYEIDSVKVEKANALRRYNRQRNLRWIFEICAALLVVLSLSTTWVPVAVETARDFLRRFIAIFDCTLYVLLLVMIIILIIYAYSGQKDATSDVYDEFIEHNDSSRRFFPGEEPPTQEETFHDKHMVCSDNAVSPVHEEDCIVSLVTKPLVSPIQSERVAAVSKKALRKNPYRRTISERFEQRIEERSRRVFRRSETEICRKLVISGEEPSRRSWSYSVDNLSKEEFNRTVDAFIAEKKKILREECKEERKKESNLALAIQKY